MSLVPPPRPHPPTEHSGRPLDRAADLAQLCEQRLREALAPSGSLFDRQRDGLAWRPVRGSEGLTSSAIALISLSRALIAPERIGLDPHRTLAAMIERFHPAKDPGPVGLMLWAGVGWNDASVARCWTGWVEAAGGMVPLARRLRTMELAWLVAGLGHWHRVDAAAPIRSAFDTALAALVDRFEPSSRTFSHAEAGSPWLLQVRRHVSTFADQIYPVQALALASIVAGNARALDVAAAAALRMVEIQGGLGQWWWHHDPRDGRVLGSYPVYSVHQHGMVPMSFRTLALAGGPDLAAAVEKGREWLARNELGVDLVDRRAGTIWRSIVRDEGAACRLVRHARRLIGPRRDDRPAGVPPRLRVNRETRPYEWAWYLFAAAVEGTPPPPEHLA